MSGMAAMPHAAGRPVLSSVANNHDAGAARAMRGSAFIQQRIAPVQAALHGSASLRALSSDKCRHLPAFAPHRSRPSFNLDARFADSKRDVHDPLSGPATSAANYIWNRFHRKGYQCNSIHRKSQQLKNPGAGTNKDRVITG
ncbi:hypothetical protein [Burkholderia puraquae]|uniref:hypothetical protein n=1 Tax=Burkholderia puraquae TaxID=1904757 RepID=UPI0013FE4104|nr:hypothetical protein [Burkholderia puraquae]